MSAAICGHCGRPVVFVDQEPHHTAWYVDHLPVSVVDAPVRDFDDPDPVDLQEADHQGIWW